MLLRPTLQARAGFDPTGYGPGISAPYGYSPLYVGYHNGEDWFWLGKESANRLGISTEQSKRVYPVRDGYIGHVEDSVLGLGLWQQIDATHRFYWWHLRDREPAGVYGTDNTCGRMGRTGSGAGNDEHLHSEVRRAPYRKSDRINPAPFFAEGSLTGGDGTPIDETEQDDEMKPIVFKRITGNAEWSLIAPWLDGPTDLEQGYLVTEDPARGLAWERMYARGSGTANNVDRDGYVAAQAEARTLRAQWVADGAVAPGSAPTAQENATATAAALAPRLDALSADVNKSRTLQ